MIKGTNILKWVLFGVMVALWTFIYFTKFNPTIISCTPDTETQHEWLFITEIMEDELVSEYIPKTIDDYEIVSIDWGDEKINLVCYDGIDKKSFKIITDSYSKDKNGVYFWREKRLNETNHVIYEIHNTLEGIDPLTFENKGQWIISDKNGIYFTYRSAGILQYQKINELDNQTFSFIDKKWSYIQDKNWFYYFYISQGKIKLTKIGWINLSKFRNIWWYIYKDDKNIIYSWVVRKDIDLATFWYSDLYQIDKNHIYNDLRIVEWLIPEKTVAITINDEDYLTDWEIVYRFPPIWGWPRKIEMNGYILRKYLEKYSQKIEFDVSYFQ